MEVKTEQESADGRSRRSWPLLPLVFFLILAAASVLLHFEKNRCQKRMLTARQQFNLIARAAPVEKVKALRGWFYKTQYYLGYPSRTSFAVSDFVRRLSGIIALPQVLNLQIDPGIQDFSFKLTVGVAANGPEPARWVFAGSYEKLKNFPEITRISFAESNPAPGDHDKNRVYVFSITGQAEI